MSVGAAAVKFGAPCRGALAAATLLVASLCAAVVMAAETALTLVRGPGDAEVLELSLEDLAALPQVTVVTRNSFVDGEVAFRGPLARDVIDQLALGGAELLRFFAANEYSVDIPGSDLTKFDAILAMEADGKPLSRRDKGPLWLIYPISDNEELTDPVYDQRLIWQVVRIESL